MQEIENLSVNFLDNWDFSSCVNLCRFLRAKDFHHLNKTLCEYFLQVLGSNVDLLDELGMSLWYLKEYEKSFQIYSYALEIPGLDEKKVKHLVFNQHFSGEMIWDYYTKYPKKIVDQISCRTPQEIEKCVITFTMTTCKRTDLFYKTINSFLNCVTDVEMIGNWYIIDDNTSSSELDLISRLYPFFKIIRKSRLQKGHPQSMNIIRDLVTTPFLFHMEDDWMFYRRLNYMTKCLDVVTSNSKYGQCLVNVNYSELPSDGIPGGFFDRTTIGTPYYQHEYYAVLPEKFVNIPSCAYWPHFSFRPSLVNTKIFRELGKFDTNVGHFEMDYAYKYISKGYISCFLPYISSKHIGRLTSERHDKTKTNAYELNGECQFVKNTEVDGLDTVECPLTSGEGSADLPINKLVKNFVINLDRRTDRWSSFLEKTLSIPLVFNRFSAIDGRELVPTRQLFSLFDTNDYKFRKGMVGCALTHLQLIIQLVNDPEYDMYLIVEDDVDFSPDFYKKYSKLYQELSATDDWGLMYLGHTAYPQYRESSEKTDIEPSLERLTASESIQKSMGGAFSYLLHKRGAISILEYIAETGMTNAIDTMEQRAADKMGGIHYCVPNIVLAKVAHQSDIQNKFDNLYLEPLQRLEMEEKILKDCGVRYSISDKKCGVGWWVCEWYISINLADIDKVKHLLYTNRLKKINNGKIVYTVSDCIKYK